MRLKTNVNLKKIEDQKLWPKNFSNLHKQICPEFNYMLVKTDMKPAFPHLQCHYDNTMPLLMEKL